MKKYQKMRNVVVAAICLAGLIMMFSGCKHETGGDPNVQKVTIKGTVKDVSGIALSGVRVTTGTLNTLTDANGKFSFTQAVIVDKRYVVKFEKNNYFTLTRSGDKENEITLEVMLYPKGNTTDLSLQTTFNASSAQTLQVGGVTIELPAAAFATADGSEYSGTVKADVLYLAPGNENTVWTMPGGDLTCIRSDQSVAMILPIGMVDVIFTNNSDNPLKIKGNTDVKITFAAPTGATAATVPLWIFDETKGVWTEDGELVLQGSGYTGTVNHFTSYGAGPAFKTVIIQVYAMECNDKPAAGASVVVIDASWEDNIVSGMTNSAGVCTMKAPVYSEFNTYFVVKTTYKGTQKSSNVFLGSTDYGKQIVYAVFDDNCNNTSAYPEKLSVKYKASEQLYEYVTYDNWCMRQRIDDDWTIDPVPDIQITDYLNCVGYTYGCANDQGGREWCDDYPIDNCNAEDHDLRRPGTSAPFGIFFISDDTEQSLSTYFTQLQDEQVAGKTCKVWVLKTGNYKLYLWGKLIMREMSNGNVMNEVLAITEDVPASAFTKTVGHDWIQ